MSILRRLREERRLSQSDLASLVGSSQPQIARLEKAPGDRDYRKMTKEWAERLAPFLGVAAEALLFDGPATRLTGAASEAEDRKEAQWGDALPVEVVGPVQAGHFLVMGEDGHMGNAGSRRYIASVRDPDFPELRQFAFEVLGDSVDQLCPPNGYAVCINFAETGLAIRSGMVVVADRERAGLIERTVKVVKKVGSAVQLLPASSNPIHKPITFPSAEPHEEVRVFALVRRFVGPMLRW